MPRQQIANKVLTIRLYTICGHPFTTLTLARGVFLILFGINVLLIVSRSDHLSHSEIYQRLHKQFALCA